jgi:hypothetical protein
MFPNTSETGRQYAIGNRAANMIRANLQNQGSSNFMRNYNRIIRARNNMLSSSRGLSNG